MQDGEQVTIKGDKQHPANRGRLCSKGAALAETLGLEGRLLSPEINQRQASWDEALDHVATRFRNIIDEHGPDAVAFYVSGQLLTEDYYVANKLMKGFIGSANIDTNSRLCMSSSVAGHKRAFGTDTVPCSYTDLEVADLVVLTGSNTAWCHPVLFQRIKQAKTKRPEMRIVVIDPRQTETCDIADLHLPLIAGSDVVLFNGLLSFLEKQGRLDRGFIDQHTEGFDVAIAQAHSEAATAESVARQCGVPEDDLLSFYRWFADTEKTVSVYSQGINQWSFGTDKVNAIINCHLATGRIGKPGQGPFSFTGQPNAMGGREVGGLANQLAAHMDFTAENINTVGNFWNAQNIAKTTGLKAVDLFRAIEDGKVKALWVMATNPLVSMPETEQVKRALQQCQLLVVSDCVKHTDTALMADVLLPATTWGEKDGTVTNSERCISRQRAFLPPPGNSRPDWWIITQVARRLGYQQAFDYGSPVEIWREHATLTGYRNNGQRALDISRLSNITETDYHRLDPQQWPCPERQKSASVNLFSDGRFFHADKRARFVAVRTSDCYPKTGSKYPLILNTGRIRDQWHTMTRTGKVARLSSHRNEPYVEIHLHDAERYHVADGQLANVSSSTGNMLARVSVSNRQRPGSLFIPMHWSNVFAKSGKVGALVNAVTDPVSGQPQFKHTPVAISPVTTTWKGFVLTREFKHELPFPYWVRQKKQNCMYYEIAGEKTISDWPSLVRRIEPEAGDWIEFQDKASGYYRAAHIVNDVLNTCIFVANDESLPDDQWLDSLFSEASIFKEARASLLAGTPPANVKPPGKTICACFNVGLNTIMEAIKEQKLTTVEAIGEALQAGTNCGSCLPELDSILHEAG